MFKVMVEYDDDTEVVVSDCIVSLDDALVLQDNLLNIMESREMSNLRAVSIERMELL